MKLNRNAIELARTATGLVNVLQPERRSASRAIARVAGSRQLLQAAATLVMPELRVLGLLADGLHAASMLAVALGSKRTRRTALTQATIAAAFAVAEYQVLQDEPVPVRRTRAGRR